MTIKYLEEFFVALEARQTKYEEYQKQTDTKLDQITAALEFLNIRLDNLAQAL